MHLKSSIAAILLPIGLVWGCGEKAKTEEAPTALEGAEEHVLLAKGASIAQQAQSALFKEVQAQMQAGGPVQATPTAMCVLCPLPIAWRAPRG